VAPDFEALLGPLTQQLGYVMETTLAKAGAFAAFGAGITREGEVVHLPAAPDEQDPEVELRRLVDLLGARKFHLGIIIVNTRIVHPLTSAETDAVWWIHEDRDGDVMHSFLPYELADNGVEYGDAVPVPDPTAIIYG
jgi:hypothetical protein